MSYVFGPVPSRRLGRSLGVDVVPLKTCTYDCIYCQLGRTTRKTTQRREWVPLEDVIAEVGEKLSAEPDYVTLSGSGEPTLYSRIGELVARIKRMTDIPVAVLTNGSLLWDPGVRKDLLSADLVVPSLDAADAGMFRAVNRPHEDISFDQMLRGLKEFRREFPGQYWLEIFLLAGYTDSEAEVAKLAGCARMIGADRVQLNTVTRPPAEAFAVGVSLERVTELAQAFEPPAEVIVDFQKVHQRAEFAASREEVLAMLRRRPCSIGDIANGLGLHPNEVVKYVSDLKAAGMVSESRVGDTVFYRASERPSE